MLRKNFPGRVKIRRRAALARMKYIESPHKTGKNGGPAQTLSGFEREQQTLEDRITTGAR